MRLDINNNTCLPNEEVLLFINKEEIRGIDILQPYHHTIPTISHSSHVLSPNNIDFLFKDGRLYWTDSMLNEIKTAGLSNGIIDTILDTDLKNIYGFAIDWISRNMYFSTESQNNSRILACNLNGEYITEIHVNLMTVVSIVLDPAK